MNTRSTRRPRVRAGAVALGAVVLSLMVVGTAGAYGLAPALAARLVVVLVVVLVVLVAGHVVADIVRAGRAALHTGSGDTPRDPHGRVDPMGSSTDPDEVPDTAAALDTPGGAAAGFWDGLAAYGPGYAHGTVFVRTDPAGWEHGLWPAPTCPDCGSGDGLSLVWLEDRPDLARLWCACGTTWTHPAWCTPMGTAWALDADEGHEGGHERAGADVDPRLAHLAEMIRRQAGNAPRPGDAGA